MKILVIGGGGREHALVWKLKQSQRVETIYCAPGNAGTEELAINVPISATDIKGLLAFAQKEAIDLTVVGMDDPLMLGVVDLFQEAGLKIFGPTKAAAIIEGSKAFSKDFMKKYNIPTASYATFEESHEALAYIEAQQQYPLVLKADGLALGKGVLICQSAQEARQGIHSIMTEKQFGEAGKRIVIEEFMTGHEVSVLAFCDGETVLPMVSAQDHKRALDGDEGLNTGGMGTLSPSPYYSKDLAAKCQKEIFEPTIKGMKAEGRSFTGILFFGLMLTKEGPKVLEYNARLGDPETQVVLPRMENDLVEVLEASLESELHKQHLSFKREAAVCVVMASGGYPVEYTKGFPIKGLDGFKDLKGSYLFQAGTKRVGDEVLTNGGRVLGITSFGDNLEQARENAYRQIQKVYFQGAHYRKDIGIK